MDGWEGLRSIVMSIQLQKDESVEQGIRRILQEEAAGLIADLRGRDLEEAIHEARKRCKRVRAIARLFRPVADAAAQRENEAFRGFARFLSSFRDATVIAHTFAALVKRQKGGERRYASLKRLLNDESDASPPAEQRKKLARLARDAQRAHQRLGRLRLPAGLDFGLIEQGLRESYRRGRDAMAAAYDQKKVTAFHEWRKRVKDLDYQLQVLSTVRPDRLKRLGRELAKLGEVLGQEHDLAVVRAIVSKGSTERIPAKLVARFLGLVDRRAVDLQTEARKIGRRVYAEKPKAFLGRMRKYWNAWQA